jgi:predicted dehydrogenase
MDTTNRRAFLQAAGGATVGLALAQKASAARAERVAVAVIGAGGMGSNHLRSLAARADVELLAVCDVDQRRSAEGVQAAVAAGQSPPAAESDLRRVLERPEIQAVFIATPDHWHVPAALLALAAGKHVYVEKPCSHNIREGRLLVEAAARSGRTVQIGTQTRSSPVVREAMERLHRGEIGDVLVAKAWNSQLRGSIGKTRPSAPPDGLDFDLWLGPAPATEYRSNLLHANWRWWHDFGCGDMGNDGVHDLDVALWGLQPAGHPSRVVCLGGKCFFDDDQQFPDTQYAVFEYPGEGPGGRPKQLVFEQRIWSPYVQEGYENGAAFYGTQGMLLVGHSVGWKLFGPRNKLLAERSGSPALEDHHQDFLECVRGRRSEPTAPAAVGHQAATLVHLANLAARTSCALEFDPASEQITNSAEAAQLVRRRYRANHWAVPAGL